MSMADDAQAVELLQREDAIEAARIRTQHRDGPRDCVQCGRLNDRKKLGFAACTVCVTMNGMAGALRVR